MDVVLIMFAALGLLTFLVVVIFGFMVFFDKTEEIDWPN